MWLFVTLTKLRSRDLDPNCVRCVRVVGHALKREPEVKVISTISLVSILGMALSLALFATSAILHDGMSLIATVVLSSLSTLAGLANGCERQGKKKRSRIIQMADGVVVRYRNGSFLIVKCSEDVARESYYLPGSISYRRNRRSYQIMSLIGTSMLMVGVVCLANATQILQNMWAGSYVLLNASYWLVASLDESHKYGSWKFPSYTVTEHAIQRGNHRRTYAEALYAAIVIAGSADWVDMGGSPARPDTQAWKTWAQMAGQKVSSGSWAVKPLPSDGDLLWDYSGELCTIPDWDVYEELKKQLELHRDLGDPLH